MDNKLEKQFCLGMRMQIKRRQEYSRKELSHILMEAVVLTVPAFPHKHLEQLVLSILGRKKTLAMRHITRIWCLY